MAEKDLKMFPKEEKNDSESFLTCKEANSSIVSTTCDDQSVISLTSTDHNIGQYSTKDEVCSICIKTEQFRSATHFCTKCEPRGKYLCGSCLKNHTDFLKRHRVLSLSVDKKSKYKEKTETKVENKKEGTGSENIKRWLLADDLLYSRIGESDKTTIISDTSQTLVENSVTSRTMASSTIATSDGTEIIGSDDQSLNIPNLQLFERDSKGFDSLHGHRKDLVNSENTVIHRDIHTGLLNRAPITLPDATNLRQNILRERGYALQARSMQNLHSEQYEDSQEENWTSGNEHGYSGARTDDSVVYERIANVPQNMEISENVTLRKHKLRPARSMQNIYSRQNEDNLTKNREYEGVYHGNIGWIVDRNHLRRPERSRSDMSYMDLRYDQEGKIYNPRYQDYSSLNHGAFGGVNYGDMGWNASRNHLRRPEKSSDVSYMNLRNDQGGETSKQRYRDYSSLNNGKIVSSYDLYGDKTKKKCIVM